MCSRARFAWDLAVEQHRHWHPGRTSVPGYLEKCRQQQALRDFAQARANCFGGTHGRPSWRKADARKGWAEKASTGIARRFDLIRVEDLQIGNMTRSAKGQPGIRAPGRVEKVRPHYTSHGAWRAGTWTRSRVRAKRASCARPAVSPATRT